MNTLDTLLMPLRNMRDVSLESLLLVLLGAFVIGQANAWCYKWTHRGVSYSRTFTQALILITVIGAMSSVVIVANPLAALGMLGGLAIIRFRTVVRDARDNVYVLLCLICGLAVGLGHIAIAALGAAVVNLIALYMHRTAFGAWRAMESMLRFEVDGTGLDSAVFEGILQRFCYRHAVVSVDETPPLDPEHGPTYQCMYKIRLRDPALGADLVSALKADCPIGAVHLLVDQENEEVA